MNTELNNQLIRAMVNHLEALVESEELSVNDVSYINDDLDLMEVSYFGYTPDGDKQQEYADAIERGDLETIGFLEALEFLSSMIKHYSTKLS
jgi:hypothetical protein